MKRQAAICLVFALVLPGLTTLGATPGVGGKKDFKCFTGNAYFGAEIENALAVDPNDINAVIAATTEIYGQILASEPPLRLAALAQEIAVEAPDVAGLVEMYTVEIAPATLVGPGELVPGEFSVVFDYIDLLSDALAAAGGHYKVAVVSTESDITLPLQLSASSLGFGRVIDHEVILYRSDLPPGYLGLSNPQAGQFSHFIQVPDTDISVKRGWCSVDVFTRGERFRYICSHLEDESQPALQYVQAEELLAGPASTTMPVLLTGDFNADPLGRNLTFTYPLFPAAGFQDAWTSTYPSDPAGGLTWGHDPALADPTVPFVWRLDLVLYRGTQFHPTQFQILDPIIGATPPLWPSDHATVTTTFMLGNANAVEQDTAAAQVPGKKN